MLRLTHDLPIVTSASAMYAYDEEMAEHLTRKSTYGDVFSLYRETTVGQFRRMLLPREACPMGKDRRVDGLKVDFQVDFTPRNTEQSRVIKETIAFLKQDISGLVRAPTGFGKTACAMPVIAAIGRKTAIIVPKEDCRDQWYKAAVKHLKLKPHEIGFIQADECNTEGKKLVICSLKSIAKFGRYPERIFRDFGLVIWDEVHRVGADFFANSAWQFPAKLRLGLSAKPERKDGKDILLYSHIGPIRVSTEMMALVPIVYVRNSGWSVPLTNQQDKKGKWALKPMPHKAGRIMRLCSIMGNDWARNNIIGKFVHKAWERGRITIVFCDTKDHLEQIQQALRRYGIPFEDMAFYIGGLTTLERTRAAKKKVLLATYAYCAEATDIPQIDTMVMGTPRSDVVQIVGRMLREYEGKAKPALYDLLDGGSNVLLGYYRSRLAYYKSIGATVKILQTNK